MAFVNIPQILTRRLQARRLARNNMLVTAACARGITDRTNLVRRWKRKELWRWHGQVVAPLGSAAGTINRWRFRGRVGTGCFAVGMHVLMARHDRGLGPGDRYCKLELVEAGVGSLGSCEVHGGNVNNTAPVNDTPDEFVEGLAFIFLSPGAKTVEGLITNENDGRIIAVSVFEVSLPPDTDHGYFLSGAAVGQSILDAERGAMKELTAMWRNNASPTAHFSVEQDSAVLTRTSATPINIYDLTSTSVSASTPGPTFDLRYKATEGRATVPVVFAAYASRATAGTGVVFLVDSTGTQVGQIQIVSATPQWVEATVSPLLLPATEAKYDLHFRGTAVNPISLYAVSLYEYEAA